MACAPVRVKGSMCSEGSVLVKRVVFFCFAFPPMPVVFNIIVKGYIYIFLVTNEFDES